MNIGKNNPSKEEKRKQKIVEKERKQHHNELIKEANKTYNEEKIAPNDSFISLVNVNKIYDNHVQAVFNFNLDIKENEFIVFVGPSGCGKSTTLRMIAGLEDITYGDLFIQGKYSNITPPKDRDLAMVFQSYALYPHMSVYDNMAFGLKIKKVKMPVYKKNDCKLINKRIIKLEKELNKLNSINKDDSTNKTRIEEINNEINNLKEKYNEELKKSKEIDTFIDKKTIKNKNKKVKEIEKEIALTNSKINELSKIDYSTLHNLKDKHEQLKTKYFETQSTLTKKQKNDLLKQKQILIDYCNANGICPDLILTEIASGMNENRKEFNTLIDMVINNEINKIFITYKDRLTRFGFDYFANLFKKFDVEIVTLNNPIDEVNLEQELTEDLISIIHHFSMKMYSNRRKKLKEIQKELEKDKDD